MSKSKKIRGFKMAKWKLFLTTLPYVLGVVFLKELTVALEFVGLIDFSEIALVLTGGIFLIGFMLAGTMADYKESEKIPGEIASALESAEDTLEQGIRNSKDPKSVNLNESKIALYDVGKAIYDWFYKRINQEKMYEEINKFAVIMAKLEGSGVNGSAIGKILGSDVNQLRKLATRVGVISRTGFLATGYALLEVLIACIIGILMIARFKSHIAEMIIVSFVSLIYIYMYRLIKDVDDPFEYNENGEPGATEVPLFPIEEYLSRLGKRIQK